MENIVEIVLVSKTGCIINPAFPWLAGSSDGKVISSKAGMGIIEVKCPYSNRQITPKAACSSILFYCELSEDRFVKLKRSHKYCIILHKTLYSSM